MMQERPDPDLIKAWIREFGAEWHRNRDGSYSAMIEHLSDPEAWDKLQEAAENIPGPALVRYGCYREVPVIRGGSPRPTIAAIGGKNLVLYYGGRFVREYNAFESLAACFAEEPDLENARLEILWPGLGRDKA
jgi:hypothetical protein